MKVSFDDIINKHHGKTGYVCGLSSSLKPYLSVLESLSRQKGKNTFISCNDFDLMTNIDADFWVIANNVVNIENTHTRFNQRKNTMLLYADTVDMTDRSVVDGLLTINYLPYDQRHFGNKDCPVMHCCKHRVDWRLTIQEILKKITGYETHYGTGSTVALHMLALAIILGLNPIYVIGVDLDYRMGYVDGSSQPMYGDFDDYIEGLRGDFHIINESAKKIGVNIYNLSEISKISDILETRTDILLQ